MCYVDMSNLQLYVLLGEMISVEDRKRSAQAGNDIFITVVKLSGANDIFSKCQGDLHLMLMRLSLDVHNTFISCQ